MPTPRPPIPEPPHEGGCLCGAVRYRLAGPPLGINACHCRDCQYLTGATHLLMILAHSAGFAHLGGELARWRKRAASGREIDIVRCARCGVRMWHEPLASPEFVFIAAGTLDRPGWAVPASHIWTASALPGTGFLEDAVRFDAQPPSRQALIEAFEGIYGTSPSTGPATAPRH